MSTGREEFIEKLLDEMTLDELCGQLINFNVAGYKDLAEFEELVKRVKPGAIFVTKKNKEDIKKYVDIINKHTKVPAIVSADIENGAGCCLMNEEVFPDPMAWGAADDVELIERAGRVTGEICRKNGIHWNFAPIVDISYNKDNPVVNTRGISDSPEQVAKIASAYVRGMQENGMMIAGCKHFPGDGVDDRNQHFCTTVNPLTKEEWLKTFGYVYKKMIEAGAASVMVGHIGMPLIEDEVDPILGTKPGTLSYNIMTGLLRETLGFEGCIVSDAMAMVGACSMCPPERLAIEYIKAGGDSILFALESDFNYVRQAVLDGEISIERIKESVRRVLVMKMRAGLLDENAVDEDKIEVSGSVPEIAQEIADKSITIIRNSQNLIPLNLKAGAKILMINFHRQEDPSKNAPYVKSMTVIKEELEARGFKVDSYLAPEISHYEIEKRKDDYDCILLNARISSRDYLGGTLRINWDNIMPFWRGIVLDHPCVIFTSFGDPYKLYELPFLRTYVNAYSSAYYSQRALVKVLLGEKEAEGKSPVALDGFFKREV